MSEANREAERLVSKAENLMLNPRSFSRTPKDGFIRCLAARYLDAAVHAEVLALFDRAVALCPEERLYAHKRATQHLVALDLDAAEREFLVLSSGTPYPGAKIALVQIYIERKQSDKAKALLREINEEHVAAGLPKYKLSDLKLF